MRTGRPQFPIEKVRQGELLSQLIHKIGHEIGNPLTSIISFATILDRFSTDTTPEKISDYGKSIIKDAWKISRHSERLVLLLSERPGNAVGCDMEECLDMAIHRLKTRHNAFSDCAIELEPSSEPTIALVDQEQLLFVICELISNAEQYTKFINTDQTAKEKAVILTTINTTNDMACIAVSNQRATPCPFELDKVFELFITEQSDTKQLGIGLTVIWAIVSRFGGELEVREEETESGFRFTTAVSFPRSTDGS